MATFTYQALILEADENGDPTAVTPGVLSISSPWPLVDLSYNFNSPEPDDSWVTGMSRATVRINGALLSYDQWNGFNMNLTRVDWGTGSGIFMSFDYGPGNNSTAVVQVDGDEIPVTDLASLEAFEAIATFGRVTSGDWAPGNAFEWDPTFLLGALSGLTGYSEVDDYVNTLPDQGNSQRFRMRDGDDRFTGNSMREEVYGGRGNDTLAGNDGNDSLYGEDGNDSLSGGNGFDSLFGGDGDDVMDGGASYDLLEGGVGKDTIFGGDGSDELYGQDGADSLLGGRGSDALWGGIGNDIMQGDNGNDWLRGEDGNDRLDGGRGNDMLEGGLGADRFTFRDRAGRDVVLDFSVAEGDTLMLSRALFDGARPAASVIIATYATDLGSATRFDFGDGDTLTLFGVADPASLAGSISVF